MEAPKHLRMVHKVVQAQKQRKSCDFWLPSLNGDLYAYFGAAQNMVVFVFYRHFHPPKLAAQKKLALVINLGVMEEPWKLDRWWQPARTKKVWHFYCVHQQRIKNQHTNYEQGIIAYHWRGQIWFEAGNNMQVAWKWWFLTCWEVFECVWAKYIIGWSLSEIQQRVTSFSSPCVSTWETLFPEVACFYVVILVWSWISRSRNAPGTGDYFHLIFFPVYQDCIRCSNLLSILSFK